MPFLNQIGKFEDLRCGLIYILKDIAVPVPLKKVRLNVKIVDFIAEVTIVQDYVNSESNPIEVLYSYPVEESAAIIGFEATIDGHEIEAVVKEKEEAKAEYDQAMRQGNSAILLDETAPDIFSMKLGQLKPGAGASVKLTYIMELPIEDKFTRLSIPTTIAPRYIPPTDDSEAAKEISKLQYNTECQSKTPLHIFIDTFMKNKIKKISSPSHDLKHDIKAEANENGQFYAKSSLVDANTDVMDRDMILLIEGEDQGKPVVFVEKTQDSTAAMISLIPSFKLEEQKTELIFLVDRSGSMGFGGYENGLDSISQAKKALQLFLHSLPADCYFNIWSFGSSFSSLFKTSVKYDDNTLAEAKNHVAKMEANYGGTEVYRPLENIFKSESIKDYAKQVFLLTDGAVSNDNQVIALVKKNRNNCRVFTLGLGESASRHLVKGVARAGNGTSIFATLKEDLRPKVLTLLKNSLMPSLTNVQVQWNNEKHPENKPKSEPKRTLLGFNLPTKTKTEEEDVGVLFDGTRMLDFKIFGKDKHLSKVTVTAQAPDGPLSIEVPIEDSNILEDGKFLHQMAARRRIQDLEESVSEDFRNPTNDNEEEIKTLALKYGIASKYTSFIGVDKKTRKHVLEPAMSTRQIQQEVPRGFGGFAACAHGGPPVQMFLQSAVVPERAQLRRKRCAMASGARRSAQPKMAVAVAQMAQPQALSFGSTSSGPLRSSLKKPTISLESSKVYDCDSEEESDCDMNMDFFDSECAIDMDSVDSTDQDDLEALINLQMANGSFKYGSGLGHSEEEMKKSCPSGESFEVWITACAIIMLETKYKNDKDLWELVADKAKKFLKSNVKGSLDDVLKKALSMY